MNHQRRTRTLIITALLALSAFSSCTTAPPFYLGGIQVNEPDPQHWAQTLKAAGLNTVEVTVYAKQGDWDSDNLWFDETDPGVLAEIKAAKAAGLQVALILRVALDHAFPSNKFLWHGMIMPPSDDLIHSWFEKYRRFVACWARIAADHQVELLVIGSEMNALSATRPTETMPDLLDYFASHERQQWERDRTLAFADAIQERDLWVRGFDNYTSLAAYLDDKILANQRWAQQVTLGGGPDGLAQVNTRARRLQAEWRQTIRETRAIYPGQLSYAANFDNYAAVGFWSALDAIGINAYFPLRTPNQRADGATLTAGWNQVFDDLESFTAAAGLAKKPIVFTELGYLSRRDTTLEPWSGFGFSVIGTNTAERLVVWNEQPVDHQERAAAVAALHQVVTARQLPLAGLLYWKLSTQPAHAAIEPFVLVIGADPPDPLEEVLRRFRHP